MNMLNVLMSYCILKAPISNGDFIYKQMVSGVICLQYTVIGVGKQRDVNFFLKFVYKYTMESVKCKSVLHL